jgi:hypothetical protein
MRRVTRVTSPLLASTGIAALAVGVLGLLCGTCGVLDTAMMVGGPGNADMRYHVEREAPAWIPIMTVRSVGLLLLSVVALVAGLGLLGRQPWARWAALGYAGLSIPLHLLHGVYGVAVYMPAMQRFMMAQAARGPGFASSFRTGFLIGFAPPLAIWLSVSVFLLVAMLTPQVARALEPKRKKKRRHFEEDVFDGDGDRPRRRRRDDHDDFE